jgi:phosphatidylethanolamine-binding protein (PEBP) family uncharacterized protein
MRLSTPAALCAALAAVLCLSACGGSDPSGAVIAFKSPDIQPGRPIPALYTCAGKDISPPLEWGSVPSGTSQLVLLVVGLAPTGEGHAYSASVEYAMAGINPSLHRLAANAVPSEATAGRASNGQTSYSVCPKPGVEEPYQFTLYAVPSSLTIESNFEGIAALAELSKPGTKSSALGTGEFVGTVKRK